MDQLPGDLARAAKQLEQLRRLAEESGISINALCLNFLLGFPEINCVLIGVDSMENLKENLNALDDYGRVEGYHDTLKKFMMEDENIILPFHWRK